MVEKERISLWCDENAMGASSQCLADSETCLVLIHFNIGQARIPLF